MAAASAAKTAEAAAAAAARAEEATAASKITSTLFDVPCLFLSLELPPAPLFKDAREGHTMIPQVPLFHLLNKFGGNIECQTLTATERRTSRYTITKLPPFLVLHARRFAKNNFFQEKNPVIITLPVKDLNMRPYLRKALPAAQTSVDKQGRPLPDMQSLSSRPVSSQLYKGRGSSAAASSSTRVKLTSPEEIVKGETGGTPLTVKQLSALLTSHHPHGSSIVQQAAERKDLVSHAVLRSWEAWCAKYDLVANVVHSKPAQNSTIASSDGTGAGGDGVSRLIKGRGQGSPLDGGTYNAQVFDEASSTWYDVADLHVQATLPQLVSVSESNLMVYRSQAWAPGKRADVLQGRYEPVVGKARAAMPGSV
jgi:U4/U6.U5 tri-snRNP-associated protein 2